MALRRVTVFFYGLFMDVDLLQQKGANPANVRQARLPGFQLRIGQRATLLPDPEGCAYGMVMELTPAEIGKLYSEASVRAYHPEAVLVEVAGGSRVPALCFNLAASPHPEEANPEYAEKLRDLARRLGLPQAYLDAMG